MNLEMVIIGVERAAIAEALTAARAGRRVAIVEPSGLVNGVPSFEELRLAISRLRSEAALTPVAIRAEAVRWSEAQRITELEELESLGVEFLRGRVEFVDERSMHIHDQLNQWAGEAVPARVVTANQFVVATGTRPVRPSHLRFDDRSVLGVESFWRRSTMPRSLIVVGAGDVGLDHALLLGSMGVDVTVIDEKAQVRDVYQGLMSDSRISEAQSFDVAFRLGDEVISVERSANDLVTVRLASGKVFSAEAALVCVGRVGNTEGLNLDKAGVGLDERGRVWCNSQGQTWAVPIKAIGDVIGFRGTRVLAG